MSRAPRFFDPSLYLVLDPSILKGRSVEAVLLQAIQGGVTLVQVREKNCSNEEFLHLAFKAKEVLRDTGVPLIINDRLDIALRVEADGLHVGQSDLHWTEARLRLGPDAILGVSVESLSQARQAEVASVDYFGVSSVFATETKKDIKKVWGLEGLRELRTQSRKPLVGIGGIDSTNARQVIAAGADGLAVVSAITSAPDAGLAARHLFDHVLEARKEKRLT